MQPMTFAANRIHPLALVALVVFLALARVPSAIAGEPEPFFSTPPASKHAVKTPARSKTPASTVHSTTIPKIHIPASEKLAGKSTLNKAVPIVKPSVSKEVHSLYKPKPITTPASARISPANGRAIRELESGRASKQRKHSSTTATAVVIGVLAGLLIIGCLVWALQRLLALEPRWLLSLRHSLDEAGLRLSRTLAEFADWVRLGR
jgi:hypothetical protein